MEKVSELKLKDVRPKNNYRKAMDPAGMKELTGSVKERGILQPILVRRNGKGYIIIAGHRRYEAARGAGLKTIPAIVKVASDAEAFELAVIENTQREDPNPMDEAIGFKELIALGQHTPDTLTEKLGKSLAYVTGRLKLNELPAEAQKKLLSCELSLGHALLILRLKNEGDQKKFMKRILSDNGMTIDDAKDELYENFSVLLTEAEFDTKNCEKCQTRSKNQVLLFPEAKKESDKCLDQSCFAVKTKEHFLKIAKDLEAQGVKVATGDKAVQLYDETRRHGGKGVILNIEPRYHGDSSHPRKYKTICVKCENRTFLLWESESWNGRKAIQSGWHCSDKKCLQTMNSPKSKGKKSPVAQANEHNLIQKARECRDRFLLANMPARYEANLTLCKRLAIYHLLNCKEASPGAFVKAEIYPDACNTFYDPKYLYAFVSQIPEGRLDEVQRLLVLSMVKNTDTRVLLNATPEGGIDILADFKMDEQFLNTKTKAELVPFAKEAFGFEIDPGKKKGEMVAQIMGLDLTGKVTSHLSEACKLTTVEDALEDGGYGFGLDDDPEDDQEGVEEE